MIFKILFLFLLANSNAFSNNNPEYIIKKTDDQFREINNYQVDMVISIAIPAFRMPKKKYKVYFKQPDKIKVKSRGFGLLPKTGMFTSPLENFSNLSNIRFSKDFSRTSPNEIMPICQRSEHLPSTQQLHSSPTLMCKFIGRKFCNADYAKKYIGIDIYTSE